MNSWAGRARTRLRALAGVGLVVRLGAAVRKCRLPAGAKVIEGIAIILVRAFAYLLPYLVLMLIARWLSGPLPVTGPLEDAVVVVYILVLAVLLKPVNQLVNRLFGRPSDRGADDRPERRGGRLEEMGDLERVLFTAPLRDLAADRTLLVPEREQGGSYHMVAYWVGHSPERNEFLVSRSMPVIKKLAASRPGAFDPREAAAESSPGDIEAVEGTALVVPIPGPGGALGWLMLGEKNSADPYTKEDRDFLEATAKRMSYVLLRDSMLPTLERDLKTNSAATEKLDPEAQRLRRNTLDN